MAAGHEIELTKDTTRGNCRFLAQIAGRAVMFDFDNFPALTDAEYGHPCVFKFHTEDGMPANIHAFPPVSFYDWPRFHALADRMTYAPEASRVLCRQKAHQGRREDPDRVQARLDVQSRLQGAFGAATEIIGQVEYWMEAGAALVHVFVPGARNNMLDRGHAQWLAFGGCSLAPPIDTLLPFGKRLVPDVHYVQCAGDYSDLEDRVEWCLTNRDACHVIGRNAKALFRETSTPARIWRWVEECL